ncbi:MAG TPA: MFS transporter [Stellaceae bacterium]|nr:MFS transporter [Stellaceae bacterium]
MATEKPFVDVSALVDRRITPFQLGVFAICFLIALFDGFDSQVISVTGPLMVQELHLSPRMLGPIFSAAQWGGLLGAFILGPCADRWGRRRFLIGCSLLCGGATFATPWADSATSIVVLRLLAGFGLGGASPCFVSLASEFAPKRLRAGMVTIIWGALPGSGILNGLLGAFIVQDYGWRAIYYGGGALALAMSVVMVVWLPESVGFLAARGADPERIRRVLRRFAAGAFDETATRFIITEETRAGAPMRHLFTEGRAATTIFLWITFFIDFFVLLATLIWTPGLLKMTGMPASQAALALAINNVGGIIGTIGIGQFIDRFPSHGALAAIFLGGALVTAGIGFTAPDFLAVAALSALAGLLVGGGGGGLIALAALTYPTFMRSTGIGWALGVSRFGSASGPLVVGMLVAAQWRPNAIFFLLAAIVLLVFVVLLAMGVTARRPVPAQA